MNTDHAFYIGNHHKVCQDYALSGLTANGAYAIVCDGCSSSPNSDFGARIIAHIAAKSPFTGLDLWDLDTVILPQIASARTLLDDERTLDSTLIVAWVINGVFNVRIFGDGFIYLNRKGVITLIHVSYPENTPAYLSYYLNQNRKKQYDSENFTKTIFSTFVATAPTRSVDPFQKLGLSDLTVEAGDVIGVCSDGINSFLKSDNSTINWQEIVPEFFDYKQAQGEFVTRRLNAFKRRCQKEQITHYDDISVASIIV